MKLCLTGTIFKCDASYVEGNPIPLNEVRQNAEKYWQGQIISSEKLEYLFVGKARVVDIIN